MHCSLIKKATQHTLRHSLDIAEAASSITQIFASLEALPSAEREFGGINYWENVSTQGRENVWDRIGKRPALVRALLATRILSCTALLCTRKSEYRAAATGIISVTQVLLSRATANGSDGAEQMASVVHGAAFLGRVGPGDNRDLAKSFICAQVVLSYFASGFTKLFGKEWTNGTALERIMRTHTYGNREFYRFLRRFPELATTLSHVTVAVETAFPVLVLNRRTRTLALLFMGAFHMANAKFMGLGRFAIAFMGTYPILWEVLGNNNENK